jgi:uncharacterized tellurite resistance protein B-like protein
MNLFHHSEEPFPAEESVIAILFLAVTADGSIAPEEEELVIASSNRMRLLRDQGINGFNRSVDNVRKTIESAGRDATFARAIAGLPAELRETVYALCADVVYAQGNATPEETAFLRQFQEAAHIPDDLATKVIEVMRLKNCG